jgi:hypothetical protein
VLAVLLQRSARERRKVHGSPTLLGLSRAQDETRFRAAAAARAGPRVSRHPSRRPST